MISCGARTYIEVQGRNVPGYGTLGLLREAALLAHSPKTGCNGHRMQQLEEILFVIPKDHEDTPYDITPEKCKVRWGTQALYTSESKRDLLSSCTESPHYDELEGMEQSTSKTNSHIVEQAVISALSLQHNTETSHESPAHMPMINISHLQNYLGREYAQVPRQRQHQPQMQQSNITSENRSTPVVSAFASPVTLNTQRQPTLRRRRLLHTEELSSDDRPKQKSGQTSAKVDAEGQTDEHKRTLLNEVTKNMTHKERQVLALLAGDVQRKHNARDAYIMTGAFTRSLPSLLEETATAYSGTRGISHKELLAHHSRAVAIMFIEANARITSLLHVGVQAKEVFAMVVDTIMQMLPEILITLISLLLKIPLTWLISMVLSASMPFALIPTKLPFNLNFPGIQFKYGQGRNVTAISLLIRHASKRLRLQTPRL